MRRIEREKTISMKYVSASVIGKSPYKVRDGEFPTRGLRFGCRGTDIRVLSD